MGNLILPSRVSIRVVTWSVGPKMRADLPYTGDPIAMVIETFARRKNDYQLGPFFTDTNGSIEINRDEMELHIQSDLDWGVMDYSDISSAFPLIEIRHLSAQEIERSVRIRETHKLSEHEAHLWGTAEELLARYRRCANQRMRDCPPGPVQRLRDEWDGRMEHFEYTYRVAP